ncbi:MAG: aminotransferase class I/II-fold pyridoxal phosphate-dependent enzyme, partial [Candidatus Rifleibacteriota bacterium]
MNSKLQPAKRILDLPPYLFKDIDDKKDALAERGISLLNFGVGDPDIPTPDFIVEELCKQSRLNNMQKYPAYNGSADFRRAVADYMYNRFGVKFDPVVEVTSLIGSKEGLAHFSWAFLEEGDIALIPDPGFPMYASTAKFSGAEVYYMPLLAENNFVPVLSEIPEEIAIKSKLMVLNYPHNPSGAVATRQQLQEIVDWCLKYQIIIVADAAYAEIVFNEEDRMSIFNVPGAEKIAIELHSFSKTFNMTGWRLGFAVGHKDLVDGLVQMKLNVDSGVFDAIQYAGIKGLEHLPEVAQEQVKIYKERLEALKVVLEKTGLEYFEPAGSFFVLVKCPEGRTSMEFTMELMDKCGVVTTP